MSEPTPETLFWRYRRDGDVGSLARLFDQTAPEVYRVARYLSGDAEEAEELLQETFLVLIERGPAFRAQARVMPWLLGILANKARRARARRRRDQRGAAVLPDDCLARGVDGDPVAAAEAAELRACLDRGLARLEPGLRAVLELHLQHGIGAADIARLLERPAATVRSQIHRGMESLRRVLPAGLATIGLVSAIPAISPPSLAAVRQAVLASARQATLPVATSLVVSSFTTLALLMNTKGTFACLTALFAATMLLVWRPWTSGAEDALPGRGELPGVMSGAVWGQHEGGDKTVAMLSAADRETMPEPVTALPGGEGVLVQVVAEGTGQVVADAEVVYPPPGGFDWRDDNELILAGAGGALRDLEAGMRRVGRVVRTDAEGLVRLPHYLEHGIGMVRKGEVYGWLDLERPRDREVPQVIAIGKARTLEVRVVDVHGRPLPHAPVGSRWGRSDSNYQGMSTSPDGRFPLEVLYSAPVPWDETGRRIFHVTPYFIGPEPEGIAVDRDALPAAPITMTYPPTGSLVVQLRDALGAPWRKGYSSIGQPVPGFEPKICVYVKIDGPSRDAWVPADTAGCCTVPFVALGQELVIDLHGTERKVKGPERAGQVVHVELSAPKATTILAGRLLYPSGAPAARTAFYVGCSGFKGNEFATDAQGRFRVGLHRAAEAKPAGDSGDGGDTGDSGDEVECYLVEKEAGAEHHFAKATMARPGSAAEVTVDDLVLQPTPVLVAGRITGKQDWHALQLTVSPPPAFVPLLTRHSPDGRYEVRGFASQAEHVLSVHCQEHFDRAFPFVPGTHDLDVHLIASATVEVDVRHGKEVDDPSLAPFFLLRMVPQALTQARIAELGLPDPTGLRQLNRDSLEPGLGQASWSDLAPGRYRLECFCRGWPRPVLRLEDVQVEPRRQDRRLLEAIDLTAAVRMVTLTLNGPGDERLSGIASVFCPEAEPRVTESLAIHDGVLRVPMPASEGPADILVCARGCRAKLVSGVSADRTVELDRGIEVCFALPESLPELQPGIRWALRAMLDPATTEFAGRGGTWASDITSTGCAEGGVHGASRQLKLVLPAAGRYALGLQLRRDRDWRVVDVRTQRHWVQVADCESQVFGLELAEGALAAAIAGLGSGDR